LNGIIEGLIFVVEIDENNGVEPDFTGVFICP